MISNRFVSCALVALGVENSWISAGLMQKVFSLGRAQETHDTLGLTLKEAECSSAVRTLLEASEKGVKTLEDSVCTRQSLQVEVEAVHSALDKVFWLCAKKDMDQGMRESIFMGMPASSMSMLVMFENSLPAFAMVVALSMAAIAGAAASALVQGA